MTATKTAKVPRLARTHTVIKLEKICLVCQREVYASFLLLFPTLIYYLFAFIIFDRFLSNGYFYSFAFVVPPFNSLPLPLSAMLLLLLVRLFFSLWLSLIDTCCLFDVLCWVFFITLCTGVIHVLFTEVHAFSVLSLSLSFISFLLRCSFDSLFVRLFSSCWSVSIILSSIFTLAPYVSLC